MRGIVTSLKERIDASPETLVLALGDFALISLFIILGELQHGYSLLTEIDRVVGTALPFFLGWALSSVLAGVYGAAVYRSVRSVVTRTILAWVGAVLIGQALRATSLFPGGFALAFVLVSLGIGLVLLVPWRGGFTFLGNFVR